MSGPALAGRSVAARLRRPGRRPRPLARRADARATPAALPPLRVRALKLPIDLPALRQALAGARRSPRSRRSGSSATRPPARQRARARRRQPALAGALRATSSRSAPATTPPPRRRRRRRPQRRARRAGATARFLAGFYEGLGVAGVPAVGVEVTTAAGRSAVDAFAKQELSTRRRPRHAGGRLALALLLAGGRPGQYGLKKTARDGVLPADPGRAAGG